MFSSSVTPSYARPLFAPLCSTRLGSTFTKSLFPVTSPIFTKHLASSETVTQSGRSFCSSIPNKGEIGMSKTKKLGLVLVTGVLLSSAAVYASQKGMVHEEQENLAFLNDINSRVLEIIEHSENVPGLKSEEFASLKPEIRRTWETLVKQGFLEMNGTDQEIRPSAVATQGIFEHALALKLSEKEIDSLIGVIHTPMPATPLCTRGEISKGLVDPSIEADPKRRFTVEARTTILRNYLHQGGTLYVVYPHTGFSKRTEEQQKIYKQELANYPKNLIDLPLKNSENIPTELIGATYLIKDRSGQSYVFAIKMTQAKDPKDQGEFGLWFAPSHHIEVQKRIQAVANYLEQNGVSLFK